MIGTFSFFDTRVLETFFAVRDPNLVQIFIWISLLGRVWVVYGIALLIALALVVRRRYSYAAGLAISVASSGILNVVLKGVVERARPLPEFQAYLEIWYSFPSTHAMLATALYGFLALFVWHAIRSRSLRLLAAGLLLALIALISFSRIYLGVHYVSDVLAGIALGAFCVWLGWKYAKIAHNGST